MTTGIRRSYCCLLLLLLQTYLWSQQLKSVVYDFDGLTIDQTDLPEGDYSTGDASHSIAASPLPPADMIGDRVLKVSLNWNLNRGAFGRGISRYIEFDPNRDVFNFYFYNPASNNQDAHVSVLISDDDDQSNYFDINQDDSWRKDLILPATQGWQLVSIHLSEFTDSNTGGNGIFDIAFTQNKGMLLMVEFQFTRPTAEAGNATFYLDMISFSDDYLPHGFSFLDLPVKDPGGHCYLGAYMQQARGQEYLTASQFEGLFPPGPGKKIRYVNYFLDWSVDGGTTPNQFPGNEITQLLNSGYRPVITWEPLFQGHTRLDPVQPRLQNILNGQYNAYFDAFASQLKSFNDTIIVRLMHEFEGDWYPWSICHNGNDPQQYINAFRYIVDRVRAVGATKVKWMWCVNSDYAPYAWYNWIVKAYPGDNYVDIIASDIYNNHYPVNSPWWKSFRIQATESYYYLTKYFANKPLYICEVGCRERFNYESTASESKGAWYARLDKELQSNFQKARALIFFNAAPDQNWFVNSSPGALQSLTDNIWNDDYYFEKGIGVKDFSDEPEGLFLYPNPTTGLLTIRYRGNILKSSFTIRIHNALGQNIFLESIKGGNEMFVKEVNFSGFSKGIYFVELANDSESGKERETKKVLYE